MDISLKDVMDRYGPMLGLVVALVLLVVLMPSTTRHNDSSVNASASGTQASQSATGAGSGGGGAAGATPGVTDVSGASSSSGASTGSSGGGGGSSSSGVLPTGAGASGNQTLASAETGQYPCRPDGRQAAISIISPPCKQYDKSKGNGGSTWRGVTATEIKVAWYVPKPDAATQAALKAAGAGDTQDDIARVMEVYRRYFNNHTQTYGREFTFTIINGSGDLGDDVAAKADANKIGDMGFFAVITTGTSGSVTFDRTVVHRGVMCINCNSTQAKSFYDDTKGMNFGSLPSVRNYYENLAEYIGKRLIGKGRTAKWAGPVLAKSPRKFGLIWLNAVSGTVDPGAQEERDYFIKTIAPKWGITGIVDSSYNYDIGQAPQTAQTVIAKMNASHVTSIMCICDALTPVFFTKEATKEAYFPEWIQTGTGLTDTTFFGRTYDQQQWNHSFGISPLWVFWQHLQVSEGYREYHHYCPVFLPASDCADGKESVGVNTYRAGFLYLAIGFSGAGPNLTPKTFAQALYDFPYTGGLPHVPLIGWTPDEPNAIKDFTEVFWDGKKTGMDEVNKQGAGILMKAAGGKRYQLGQWPTTDPVVFTNGGGEVFTSDTPYTDPATKKEHEGDGHKHDPKQRCLSC